MMSCTTCRSNLAMSCSAEYGTPPRMIGVVSPSRRLNSRDTRCGSDMPRRLAASPVRMVSSSRSSTTDGMTGARLPREAISACPSRHTAAAVKVVPRSIPSAYIASPRSSAFGGGSWWGGGWRGMSPTHRPGSGPTVGPVVTLREVFEELAGAGHPDPAAVLREHGFDLPEAELRYALVTYAHSAPVDVAGHLQ